MIRRKNNQQKKIFSASEKELFALFDYQRFENDPVLKALIDEAEGAFCTEISDDMLSQVSATGEAAPESKCKDPEDGAS